MCNFTLALVQPCQHEVPIIDYCDVVQQPLQAHNARLLTGHSSAKPPATCTDSLGWQLYQRLDSPVACQCCIAWLQAEGKRTYGGVADGRVLRKERLRKVEAELREIKAEERAERKSKIEDGLEEVAEVKEEQDGDADASTGLLTKALESDPLGNAVWRRRAGL